MRRLLTAAAIVLMSVAMAAAQPRPIEATLTVRGQGRVQVAPDHANLTVEVVTTGKSLEAATAAHHNRAVRALNALRGMQDSGLKVERSTFNLNEVRRPVPRPTSAPGQDEPEYQAVTTFELKMTKLDAIDNAVTAIASTGLFEVRNIRFGIEERNPGLNAARRNAVEDARERASTYADAAGVRLGEIARIDDADTRGPREFAAEASMIRTVKVIPPETLALSASVTITWRIAPKAEGQAKP